MRWRAIYTSAAMTSVAIAVLVGMGLFPTAPAPSTSRNTALRETAVVWARRETRPTLDPALFSGKAALAYQVAREMPDVLDQVRCYCACDAEYGHVSLLSCYTDGHAAT